MNIHRNRTDTGRAPRPRDTGPEPAGRSARTSTDTDTRTGTPPGAAPQIPARRTPGPYEKREPEAAAGTAEEIDRLGRRMERAVGGFVDDPRRAVKEADAVLEETAGRLVRLLEERRRALRESWHAEDDGRADTEELRIALTHYRDMTRQLLNVA